MKITRIVVAYRWCHKKTGETLPIHEHLCFSVTPEDRKNWKVEAYGFTWEMDNGSIGFGKPPVRTFAEAIRIMDDYNSRTEGGYTVWVVSASGEGTHHVSHHEAILSEAKREALIETAHDWECAVEDLEVLGVVEGNVNIIEWNEHSLDD